MICLTGVSRRRQSRIVAMALSLLVFFFSSSFANQLNVRDRQTYTRPDTIPFPVSNPYTPEKATLGKMLFFDTRLSRDRNLSCASCHSPSFGWEVPFSAAIGAGGKPLGRHAPTIINLAWTDDFFWDGRADSLEAQAAGPIEADVEMDLQLSEAVSRLQNIAGYRSAFQQAFQEPGISVEKLLAAIATFERTIVTGDTPFDQWVRGDEGALSKSAKSGFALFTGKAQCAECHSGWNFTDNRFHDIGLFTEDPGRMGISGDPQDQHAFKTPGLREIAARAPYMHNGRLMTLEAVVAHYASGGIERDSLSPEMKKISLTGPELKDLVAFMNALSSPQSSLLMPNLPAQ